MAATLDSANQTVRVQNKSETFNIGVDRLILELINWNYNRFVLCSCFVLKYVCLFINKQTYY
jgi:hypothetical protein